MRAARRLFEQAIELDSTYDPAYSGLARTISLFPIYSRDYFFCELRGSTIDAVNNAIRLNPKNAEAYSVLSYIQMWCDWDWSAAEEAVNKSLELNPEDPEIINFAGDYYPVVYNSDRAIELESKALELDPLHPVNHRDLSAAYATAKDWENVIRYAESARDLNFNFNVNDLLLLRTYIQLGRMDEAEQVVSLRKYESIFDSLYFFATLAIARGEREAALENLNQIISTPQLRNRSAYIGDLFLSLEMYAEAAVWYEKAYDERELVPNLTIDFVLSEDLPDHFALRKSVDKPELNALFEIRRQNLGLPAPE